MQNRFTGGKVLTFTAFILVISFMLLLSACNKNRTNAGLREIDLSFAPIEMAKLEVGKVATNMQQQKVFDFENIDGRKNVSVILYTTPTTLSVPDEATTASTTPGANTSPNSTIAQDSNPLPIENTIKNTIQTVLAPTTTEVYAFLKEGDKLYLIGVVSHFGVSDVTVEANDWNQNKKQEISISGSMDTAHTQLRIVGFDKKSKSWVNYATLDGANVIDLDKDGIEELLSVSTVSQPSHVSVLRWKKNQFETADVAKSTSNTYASLHLNNGEIELEAGKDVNGSTEKHIYQYKNGRLLEPTTDPEPKTE